MDSNEPPSQPGQKRAGWLNNPWVTAISLFLNFLSLLSGFYFYTASQKARQLAFYVNPNRATVVSATKVSSLRVLFNGAELKGSVTAAQVSIWNRGAEAIRRDAILDPVNITTEPAVPILSATIQKASREAIGFSLATDHLAAGFVPISWKILEKGDGAVVQLIYEGAPSVKISMKGTIEGQSGIYAVQFPGKIQTVSEQIAARNPAPTKRSLEEIGAQSALWIIPIFFLLGAGFLVEKIFGHAALQRGVHIVFWIVILGTLGLIVYAAYAAAIQPVPPFGY